MPWRGWWNCWAKAAITLFGDIFTWPLPQTTRSPPTVCLPSPHHAQSTGISSDAHLARIIKVDLSSDLFSYTIDEAALARAQRQYPLLLDVLDRHEPHVGQLTGSQIASASATSFLLLLTYGLTNWGAIRRTVCPTAWSLRAQWRALPQASMSIRHGCRFAKNGMSRSRRSCLRSTALSRTFAP